MQNKTTRFLLSSIAMVVVVCVLIIAFLTVNMIRRSSETIGEVGNIYMAMTTWRSTRRTAALRCSTGRRSKSPTRNPFSPP